jgi:RHS repeat-associated protein
MRSSPIDVGIVDEPYRMDGRSYVVSYAIGHQTGSVIYVDWVPDAGTPVRVYQDAANSPTGFTNGRFTLTDVLDTDGHFWINVTGGGKLYSIADNIARQQLSEPFSQQVRFAAGSTIDTSTGSFGLATVDLAIEGGPLPIALARYYRGHSDRYGVFGYRWMHTFDAYAATYVNGDVAVVFGSGREEYFEWNSSTSTFSAVDPRVTSTLSKVTIGSDLIYRHVTKHGITTTFATNTAGDLISIADRNGNQLTVYRSQTTGLVTSVEDDAGRALTFAYDGNGRLIEVSDPAGGEVTYGYDANGDLDWVEKLIASGATPARTEYTYSRHRLTRIKERQGDATSHSMVTTLDLTLDAVNRVTTATDAQGKSVTIAYQTPSAGVTRVTDALANVTDYYFDAWARTTHLFLPTEVVIQFVYDATGELEKVIDGANGAHEFHYNAARNPDQLTDPLGHDTSVTWDNAKTLPTETIVDPGSRSAGFLNLRTLYTYDSAGNLTQTVVDPTDANQPGDEFNLVTTWAYNDQGMVTKETVDPVSSPHLNLVTEYTYDASGYLVTSKTVDPGTSPHLNLTWTYTYDFAGRLKTETDPNQHTTTYVYDLAGRLIERRNHLNESIYFGHDFQGHVTSVTDQLGNWAYFTYNSRGLMATKKDGENNVWSYTYYDDGKLHTETDPLNHTTTYQYHDDGQLWKVTDPLNHTTTYTYTENGLLETVTDALGRVTGYEYDDAGRLIRQINPDLSDWEYAYDAAGRLAKEIDPTGRWTTHGYDTAGRHVESVVDADNPNIAGTERNQRTKYLYDAASRLWKVTDPRSKVTEYSYYPGGQIASVKDANGQFTYYEYDAANRLTEITDPNQVVTLFGYDSAGRRTSVSRGGILTTFAYDDRDLLLTQIVDPNPQGQSGHLALTTTYGYDAAGRRTSMTNPRGKTTAYGYDNADRLTSITDADGESVLFTYDNADQLDTVTNARGYVTDYDWDSNGNPDKVTDARSEVEDYTYNTLGQLTAMTDRRGVTTTYGYDGSGNLDLVSYPAFGGASAGTVDHAYDMANRLTSMVDALGTTSWSYDAAGNVLQVDGPFSGDAISYTYDDMGRRASMTLPGNKTITYGRDAGGRVTSIQDWASQTSDIAYTAAGLLDTIERPNGVDSNYDYDTAGRLTIVEHTNGATLLARYAYSLNANGHRTQAVITGTAVAADTESYTYDDLDRILSASYGPSDSVSWTYDENGNRLTQTSGGQTTTYSYNSVDWLTGTTGAFVSNGFYDDAGNRTGVCYTTGCSTPTDTFGYDWKGRTTSATVGGTSVSYAYTGDDVRAARTQSGTTTTYLWDRTGLLPMLVGDGTTDRVFLEDLVLEEVTISATSYPLTDGLTSVRLTTNASGTASGAVDYDAWGNVRAGTSGQIGWAGELRDPPTGQVHLRARDYSPGTGRFTSRDALMPNAPGTQGYNPYWYANNSPATLTDPAGTFAGALTSPIPCEICTPMVPAVVAGWAAVIAAHAARVWAWMKSHAGAIAWAAVGMVIAAGFLYCTINPACREGVGTVVGGAIDEFERFKRNLFILLGTTVVVLAATIAKTIERVRDRSGCTLIYPYIRKHFSKNLACLTEGTYQPPFGFDAHHVFPRQFERDFEQILPEGIHFPWYGQWWFSLTHQGMARTYNRYWEQFFASRFGAVERPTYIETLEYGRWTMEQFGLTVLY